MTHVFALFLIWTGLNREANAGEVVKFAPWRNAKIDCADKLGATSIVKAGPAQGPMLYASLLKRIQRFDPAQILMRVDATGQIWDWTPLDEKEFLDITFERDGDLHATQVMVSRGRGDLDFIITTPERVAEVEGLLRDHLMGARVIIDKDFETLFARPRFNAGLLF